jgi:hypothetical protein
LIERKRAHTNDGLAYMPHRAYPTMRLHKTEEGGFASAALDSGRVHDDQLSIREVANEAAALGFVGRR